MPRAEAPPSLGGAPAGLALLSPVLGSRYGVILKRSAWGITDRSCVVEALELMFLTHNTMYPARRNILVFRPRNFCTIRKFVIDG
jgi:hypothetical protein